VLWLRTDGRLWQEETEPASRSVGLNLNKAKINNLSADNIAGGNITTINVWGWERYGKKLLEQIELEHLLGMHSQEKS
jgi:hypothetical protein